MNITSAVFAERITAAVVACIDGAPTSPMRLHTADSGRSVMPVFIYYEHNSAISYGHLLT